MVERYRHRSEDRPQASKALPSGDDIVAAASERVRRVAEAGRVAAQRVVSQHNSRRLLGQIVQVGGQ